MTIQGALADLNNLLNADDIPFYYKGSIKKVIETIVMEFDDKELEQKESVIQALEEVKAFIAKDIIFYDLIEREKLIDFIDRKIAKLNRVKVTKDCTPCEHSDEVDGEHCYECVKGMQNNFEPQEQISKEDFKEYAKKEFNQNVEFVKSDNPDTVESLFEPREVPLSETIRPVAFDDVGLEEAILDLHYIKELEDEIEDLRRRLANAANCLSNILQIVKDPTPIEGSDYRRCCLIQSNISKYAVSLNESKIENDDLLELRIIFGRPLNG